MTETTPRRAAPLRTLRAAAALFAGLAVAAAFAAGPTTQFTLSGSVLQPGSYGLGDLQALPAVTQTVDYTAAGLPQTRTYTGTPLWGLINNAGLVTNPAIKNDVLNKYVLATGSDGYKIVFSLGELSPAFGNRPDLVAYAQITDGVSGPLGGDGFARVTAPGDIRGGRYVSNLVSLAVRGSDSTQAGTGGGPSTSFAVSGGVLRPMSFDLAALQALPVVTRVVDSITYTGASFWSLLNATVGLVFDPSVNNDLLGKYVVATGSDGYKSVFSLGELNPNFGNQPDLIAYAADGVALGDSGFARLVIPNDVKHGRWVSNLVSLEVFSATPVPEPTTWALLLAGLAVVTARAAATRRARTG